MTRSMLDQTKAIEDQTRQALHKQRQKGRFKLKRGPGRPEEGGQGGRKPMEHSSSLPQITPNSPTRKNHRNNGQKEKAAQMPDIESMKSNMFPPNNITEKKVSLPFVG
jgi:hypothetical protein